MGKVYPKMAKSKNHTSHGEGYKNHRNGIFRVKRERYTSNDMVNQKLNRNTRRARKFDPKVIKTVNYEKRIQSRRDMKQQLLDKIKAKRAAKVAPVVAKK